MKQKTKLAWAGILLFGLIPILLLFLLGPKNYSSPTHIIGQLSGLIGLNLLALTFVLSTRAKWVEYLFDGLDKVYPVHAILGASSFILILMHPIFLVLKFIPQNIPLAAKYLLPGGLISVDLGIFALVGITLLLIATLYMKIRYHVWKVSHKFMGLFFILAVLHVFLIRNSGARDYIFQGYYVYVAIVAFVGLAGFIYGLARAKLTGKKYLVKDIKKLDKAYEVTLEPVSKKINFQAGQFVFVSFLNKKLGIESHPFSIASATDEKNLRIIVKSLGDYTSNFGEVKKENFALVEGPYGTFHENEYGDEIWIAGGIGITPFIGLAKEFSKSRKGNVALFYSVIKEDEFIHLEELKNLSKLNKKFRVVPWISEKSGYLTLDEISRDGSLTGKDFYLCGPESMKNAIKKALIQRSVAQSRIHDERFAFK